MTNIGARFAVLSLITGLAVLNTAEAQEKKIKRQELPPAVEKTVAEQSQGATIKGFSTEVEAGKTLYEVELSYLMRTRVQDLSASLIYRSDKRDRKRGCDSSGPRGGSATTSRN
jgi:hypothetical protein